MRQPTTTRHLQDAIARVSGVAAIPAVLESLGADPASIFAEARVDLSLFDDRENLISLTEVGRLVKVCVARTGCQHFGLLVGQRGDLNALGLVGLLVRYSPDVGTALRRLGHFMHLHFGGQTVTMEEDGDAVLLNYSFHAPGVESVDQIEDGALAILCNILRALCGPNWEVIEVRFAHRKPERVRHFLRFFQAPLLFDAERSALVFSAKWLTRRLPDADAELQHLLRQQIDALETRHRDEFPDQVRSVLRTGLLTGQASADQVAALFSIHPRTLTRRLDAFGTSFKALVDEGRFEIARRMLQNTSLGVSQIATALDYADASAFTRAFRRWSGTTPAAWRATIAHAA